MDDLFEHSSGDPPGLLREWLGTHGEGRCWPWEFSTGAWQPLSQLYPPPGVVTSWTLEDFFGTASVVYTLRESVDEHEISDGLREWLTWLQQENLVSPSPDAIWIPSSLDQGWTARDCYLQWRDRVWEQCRDDLFSTESRYWQAVAKASLSRWVLRCQDPDRPPRGTG